MNGPDAKNQPRVLIVKLSSLGDIFHALPAVHQLKTGLNATIDWVTQMNYGDLVGHFPDVERVIGFPRKRFPVHAAKFLRTLRAEKYDLIVDLQGLLKSAFVARCAQGSRRIGPSFHREGSAWFYSDVAGPRNRNRHAVDEALDVVRRLGLAMDTPVFPVSFPRNPLDTPAPRVAIIPCSRWPTKNWPIAGFIEVANALRRAAKASIYLVGGPDDIESCRNLETAVQGPVVNTCGKTSLVELGSLLQEMDLVISVDSGPMHMAAALGSPVLAIFGATDPLRTGPYGNRHRILTADDLACRPCRSYNCSRGDLGCLRDLPPGRVIAAAQEMLDR